MINKTLQVNLGEKSYPIYVEENLISKVGEIVKSINSFSKILVITDRNVSKLHLKDLLKSFDKKKLEINYIILPSGEYTKSFYHLNLLLNKILSFKVDRQSLIISFGGGVIGDLVGLASSLVLRGLDYIQIPTTLLSQVDSSVGGKTAINSKFGKNLIGTFKQPIAVISSMNILKTLKKRDVDSGYAEVIKYSLIRDNNFFYWLKSNGKKLVDLNPEICEYAIKKSCKIKAEIVSLDEKENGTRALLNLGHTFGHVLELVNNYSNKIYHGEAVLVGIMMAIKLSVSLNFCDKKVITECEQHFKDLGLKYNINDYNLKISLKNFMKLLTFDKKIKNGKLNFILLKSIGNGFVHNLVNRKKLEEVIRKEINL